jgi:CHAT domain
MGLIFVPSHELSVAEGRAVDLSDLIANASGTLAFHELRSDSWYLVAAEDLFLLRDFRLGLGDLFEAPEVQEAQAIVTGVDEPPQTPTVLLAGGAVTGAWLRQSARLAGGLRGEIDAAPIDIEYSLGVALPSPAAPDERGGDGGNGASAPERMIRRTPHMDAPDELPRDAQATFGVRVFTDDAPAAATEESEDIEIQAPPDVQSVELGVLLTTSPGLEVVGPFFQQLLIHRDSKDARSVTFEVTVGADGLPHEAGLIVQFVHRGRPSGRVARRWLDGRAVVLGEGPPSATVHIEAEAPDLTVILTEPVPDGVNFEVTLLASDLAGFESPRKVPWALNARAETFIQQTLAGFVDRTIEPADRRDALKIAGLQIFGATPKLFQDAIWALIDAHRHDQQAEPPPAIFIMSDEPLMPWELMIPTRQRDGIADDRELPLGVEFRVGRWIRSDTTPPPQRLLVTDSLLIAAENSNPKRQLDSRSERSVLERLFNGRPVRPVTRAALDRYLQSNASALLHFVCHGAAEMFDDAIFLDEDERCSSMQLRIAKGFRQACAAKRPLVFLNTCDAGRMVSVIGGGAGFPRAFTDIGARAVIAPLWPVAQAVAADAAVKLYESAVDHPERTLADLLRDIRRSAYVDSPFQDSYAAYCFFGDPCTRLKCE